MIKRILAILHARNLEFIRDRSALGWNIAFPVLLIIGMSAIFSRGPKPDFEVAIITTSAEQLLTAELHPFLTTPDIRFFVTHDPAKSIKQVSQHQLDMLLDFRHQNNGYWINPSSPKGDILKRLLVAAGGQTLLQHHIEGEPIRYVDWLVPGILGMNIMFSCLFGIGYVIVRYRKNGYLKRLQATPITALEFLLAQIISRLLLILVLSSSVYCGINYFLHLQMTGSYFNLFIMTVLGAIAMISMALLIAARISSEELAGGLLNLFSWPMMIISGIWFPMENAPIFLQKISEFLPLTHMLNGARQIMLDGATLSDLSHEITILSIMSVAFLLLSALLFKWAAD